MERVVIDASVAVKWFIAEADHHRARDLRNAFLAGRVDVACPSIFQYEVLNALRFNDSVNASDLEEAVDSLDKAALPLHPLEGALAKQTVATARRRDITVYDASYVTLSRALRCRLVTADEQLIDAVGDEVEAVHIRDWVLPSGSEPEGP